MATNTAADVMRRIEAYMQSHMGLHGPTISDDMVGRAVQQRCVVLGLLAQGKKSAGLQQLADYLLLLQQSKRELHQLSELLVVPETWFFRYHQSFHFIRQHAKDWLQQYGQPLPILSLPCATGEEPYSIAMCLLDAGLSPDCFRIDAVDISESALAIAKQAEYGGNSFRSDDVSFRQRYCTQQGDVYRVNARVRSSVHFADYNIMQERALPGGPYALVFCRNLLIYFDAATQKKVLKKLSQLLYSDGLLFVGHGDTGPVHTCGEGFTHLDTAAFVYQKKCSRMAGSDMMQSAQPAIGRAMQPTMQPTMQTTAKLKAAALSNRTITNGPITNRSAPTNKQVANRQATKKQAVSSDAALSVVRKQADGGKLSEAEANCQHYLRQHSTDADGWSLLGVIHAVQSRQAEAIKALNKALYLNASHSEALTHLALLADQQGQAEAALRYRQRLARISSRVSSQA